MARYLTAKDSTVRRNWAFFLNPLVGDKRPIPASALAKAISANTERSGDATWQVRNWIDGSRTVSPFLAFEAGEALRACGVAWASGPLALYAAGYLGDWVETTARVFLIPTECEVAHRRAVLRAGGTVVFPQPETAALLAVYVPLAVLRENNLRFDLDDKGEELRADARSVLADALKGFPPERLRSAFERRNERLLKNARARAETVLTQIAEMARGAETYRNANPVEPAVLSAMREWGFLNAPSAWSSRIATIQLRLQELRTERLQALVTVGHREREKISHNQHLRKKA